MNVSLTPELEAFIHEQVASGRYRSVSEAVRASIRLLQEQAEEREARLSALRTAIDQGLAQLDRGEHVDGDLAFAQIVDRLFSER